MCPPCFLYQFLVGSTVGAPKFHLEFSDVCFLPKLFLPFFVASNVPENATSPKRPVGFFGGTSVKSPGLGDVPPVSKTTHTNDSSRTSVDAEWVVMVWCVDGGPIYLYIYI